MSHNVSHVKYNLLNLPDSVIFVGLSASEMVWGEEFYDWVQESLE